MVSRYLKSGLDIAATVAVLIAALMVIRGQLVRSAGAEAAAMPMSFNDRLDASKLMRRLGEAPLALIEFADYECPYCARHAIETFPRIKHELVDSGKVSYVYFHFPLEQIHRNAFKASEAAECAGQQQRYWDMHDTLFANQSRLTHPELLAHAETLGLDRVRFEKCLEGETRAAVSAALEEGRRLGVQGTPAFFLGMVNDDGSVQLKGRFNGTVPYETLKAALESIRTPSALNRTLSRILTRLDPR